ncbi:MAG: PAS domain S-box protein [Vicinamibacteria bacterium]
MLLTASTGQVILGEAADGTIALWSAGAERAYGYGTAEAVGVLAASALYSPEAAEDGLPRRMREAAIASGRWTGDVARLRRDGTAFVERVDYSPWYVDGRLLGFLSIAREVAVEPSSRPAEEATFRSLLESAPDAMVIVDRDGRIVLVNGQTERLFGYRREDLLGQPVEMLVPRRFRDRHVSHRVGYAHEPRVRAMGAGLDLHGVRKDGSEFPVEISLSPLETTAGALVSSAIRDISDRKRVERALQEKNVELERASLAKDRFLASMSHELRTPLNAIIGFTGTLLMKLPGPLTPDQEKQLGTIKTSARHLLALINDILDVAKIDAGKVEPHPEPVACADVIEEVASALRPLAQQKQLTFELDLPAAPVVVECDRRFLSQILINLAGNAIKFTDRGGVTIVLRAANGDSGPVEITVRDTGRGIPPEHRSVVFDAFSQVETESTRPREGTGLGLHLSQRLAALLGGRIAFESEPGQGSTFVLRLRDA